MGHNLNLSSIYQKLHLYILFKPFSEFLAKLIYLDKFSLWIKKYPSRGYSKKFKEGLVLKTRLPLHTYLIESEIKEEVIDYLEFGVASGDTIRWWANHHANPVSSFYGFDVFTGLPENWHKNRTKGFFDMKGNIAYIDDTRCKYIVGLFQDTLNDFLNSTPLNRKLVVHMDADLYSSTIFVLITISKKLKKGDILIFDEFSCYLHEFKAFLDFISAYKIDYEVIGETNNYSQVAIKII